MRAAILARVSTAVQATADRHSLPVQRKLMSDYAAREGWDIVATFEIPGESAYTDDLAKRPEFAAAIKAAERREFDVLLVYDLSRFARDQWMLHDSLKRLRKVKCRLIGVAMGIDYSDNPMMAGMEGVFAEASSREQSRRVRHAYAARHALGLPTGDVPFGYKRSPATNEPPSIVPEEAEAVRWAFAAYADNVGHVAIAEEFNRRGLKPHSKVGYALFVASSIQRIIESRFYLGVVTHLGDERPGRHEAIITPEQWDAAQAAIRHIRRTQHSTTLLTGIVRCSACHGPIWTSGWDRRRVNRYYREPAHQQYRDCPNARTMWPSVIPDGQIAALMRALGPGDGFHAYVEREARKVPASQPSQRSSIVAERRRVANVYRQGVITEAEWKREDAALKSRLDACPEAMSGVLLANKRLTEFAQLWDTATDEQRREAVRLVVRLVEMDTKEQAITAVYAQPQYEPIMNYRASYVCCGTPDRDFTLSSKHGFTLARLGVA